MGLGVITRCASAAGLALSLLGPFAYAAPPTSASDYAVTTETGGLSLSTTGAVAAPSRTATGVHASAAELARLDDDERLLLVQREARTLSPASVQLLEASVTATPDDVFGRAELVAWYDARKAVDPAARKRRLDHL